MTRCNYVCTTKLTRLLTSQRCHKEKPLYFYFCPKIRNEQTDSVQACDWRIFFIKIGDSYFPTLNQQNIIYRSCRDNTMIMIRVDDGNFLIERLTGLTYGIWDASKSRGAFQLLSQASN